MVELRKRKTPPPAPARPAKKKAAPKAEKGGKVAKAKAAVAEKVEAVKEAVTGKTNGEAAAPAETPATGPPKVGDSITLAGFGAEIETHEGTKTTLEQLVAESKAGVVLFTYPKASTPGCTKQACLFRDSYESLSSTGLSIYGLSNDSPKANTTFKTKQSLPYPLLCDPSQTLISAIGLKKGPKGTTRGVFVVDKAGKVLAAEAGSPDGTVDVVKKIVADGDSAAAPAPGLEKQPTDSEIADTAGEVADTAAEVDGEKPAVAA
ncbi:AhpC-TSA-domain-containing protein [Polyplosphaeria fusca]|uniref:thioredoxin-dependent peroxiredoxin n=1 Tax=Polyplosphaeria fusca TaxID=682080 RepID=A0A9P4RCS8_9PLEO|nr:AhpC-TSA-domain-containing protein [Polyplosphaeria fusca]